MTSRYGLIKPNGEWLDVPFGGKHYAVAKANGCTRGTLLDGWVHVTAVDGFFIAMLPPAWTVAQIAMLRTYCEHFGEHWPTLMRKALPYL